MSTAQIHRFGNSVAMYVGDGNTVYFTPKVARQIAKALNACARDIAKQPDFCKSEFRATEIKWKSAK